MNQDNEQTAMERKMTVARHGYLKHGSAIPTFGFQERPLLQSDVVERYSKGLEVFAEVRRRREALRVALEAQESAIGGLKAFHAEALTVARQHFGSDKAKLADFGIERRGHAKRGQPRGAPGPLPRVDRSGG